MNGITITSYVQLAALTAFAAILVSRITATASAGLNPFAFLFRKERRGVLAETAFLVVTVLFFVEVALQTFNRPIRFLPRGAYTPLDIPGHHAAGVLILATSFIFLVRAYLDLGQSWRVGTDPRQPSELVTSGIYARTRNPIYLFFMLYAVGTLIMFRNLVFLLLSVAMFAAVIAVVREEERFLLRAFGAKYDDYRSRTPRYIPWLRRLPSKAASPPRRTSETPLFAQKTWRGRLRGLFAMPSAERNVSEVIVWWERRRLYYNASVAAFCLLFVFGMKAVATIGAYVRAEGIYEAVTEGIFREVFVTIVLIITANIWYTGGWIAELLLRLVAGDRLLWFAPVAFGAGILFSMLFCAFWILTPVYTP